MYLALLVLPLTTFFCISLFGRFIGARGTVLLSVFSATVCTLLSTSIFYEVALCGSPCLINCAPYFNSQLFDASWGFLFDTLTAVMCIVVTLISGLVIIYSCSYMIADPHFIRFVSYLKLFTVAMLVLVTADNYIQLFVGWEGVGLASFLLISFWFTRLQASKSAIQAMLLNRVGDIGLALGIICLFFSYKTTNYQALFALAACQIEHEFPLHDAWSIAGAYFSNLNLLDFACILLFIGAAGKSGQLGLHAWLPNAMNAPTPVSALLHAATMVYFSSHCQVFTWHEHSAICWNSLKNRFMSTGKKKYTMRLIKKSYFGTKANQQETLRKLRDDTKGSSETVRRIIFQFNNLIYCCETRT